MTDELGPCSVKGAHNAKAASGAGSTASKGNPFLQTATAYGLPAVDHNDGSRPMPTPCGIHRSGRQGGSHPAHYQLGKLLEICQGQQGRPAFCYQGVERKQLVAFDDDQHAPNTSEVYLHSVGTAAK